MPGGALEGEESKSSTLGKSSTTSGGKRLAGGTTSYYVGRKLDEHRGAFLLEYPMDRGKVVDGGWDAMELLWEVSLKNVGCFSDNLLGVKCCWGIYCKSYNHLTHNTSLQYNNKYSTYTPNKI